MTDGPSNDLLDGIIEAFIAATGKREAYAWRSDGSAYPAGPAFGFYRDTSPETKANAITVGEYSISDDGTLSDSSSGVQFRIESLDRRRVLNVKDDLLDVFHGRWGGTLGVVTLVSAERLSGTSLGQDSNGRLGRTENYTFNVHRPSAHRS